MEKLKIDWKSLAQALAMVIISIVTLEATSLIQYYFTRKTIREEATRRAEGQLAATNLQITDVMNQVETVVRNNVWAVRKVLDRPDTLASLTNRIVETNDFISGSAIAFIENYNPEKGRMYSPYSYRDDTGVKSAQLGTESYNYLEKEWFTKPLELGKGYWSEPYYDQGGGKMYMTTYSVPVSDNEGKVVAVLTSDVSLDWLTGLVGGIQVYPGAIGILISRKGQFMVCPVPSLAVYNTVQDMLSNLREDSQSMRNIALSVLAGQQGSQTVDYQGKKFHVFYGPVERAGWSMAIAIPYEEIYGDVRRVRMLVSLLQILGVLLLMYILFSAGRSQIKLRDMTLRKSRMESELHIARNIQMAMLPKLFPTWPESNNVDMAGMIVPAKEVGGDLYDFQIMDDKLYFCIGDVSGKGIPASLVMAVTRSLFRSVSAHEKSPQRIVTSMNDSMSDMNESNMFVTLFVGVLDLLTGHLRYCNAGHNAPIRMLPGQSAALLDVIPNLPLGIIQGQHYQEQETNLAPGEGLFLYTDGLTEAENRDKHLFGEKRMLRTASLHGGSSAQIQIQSMADAVHKYVGDCEASDDLTMLSVRFVNDSPLSGAERHLILHNDISQIPQLAEFMGTIAEETKMDQGLAMSLNLALEEAVTNVIMYAYPEGSDGLVDIEAIIWKDHLDFIISDSGVPFDPTSATPPDLTLDVLDRPVGGLGIYLVKNIMDHVSYAREDGKNLLSMTKKL